MSLPILMQPPGRSTFTQSGLIELGKPVETLPDGSFKEAKIPKPKKKKNAEPELPQPAVGPPPIVSGAPRRGKTIGEPEDPLKVFQAVAQTEGLAPVDKVAPGQAVSAIPKTRAVMFAKGSQEAKDYMAKIRALRKPKAKETTVSAPAAPAPVAAAPAAEAKKAAKKAKKLDKQGAEDDAALEALRAKAAKAAAKTDDEDDDDVGSLLAKVLSINKKLKKIKT